MKKLLALFLSFMLPCCAAAETRAVTVKFSTDDTIFAAYAKEVLQGFPGVTAEKREKYVQVLRAVLKDTKFTTVIQDDAASVDLSLNGKPLLDLVIRLQGNASYITTSMLPGYILAEQQDEMRLPRNGPNQLDEAALNAIAGSVETAAAAWLKQLSPTVTHGSFQGDAYAGGSRCTTWVLSNKDIAAFVSAIATDELRAAVTQLLRKSGADAVRLLQQFDDLNHRVADADQYAYILRVVHDDEDQLVGLSLTILEEQEQIASISFGSQGNELRLVVWLGQEAHNYWREYVVQVNQRENGWNLCGSSRVWVANRTEAFSCVSETNVPVKARIWNCTVNQSAEQYRWDAALYEGITVDEAKKLASCTGSFTPVGKSLKADLNLIWLSSIPLKMQLSVEPAQEIPPLDRSLVICSGSSPEDAALHDELNQKLGYELTRRLWALLPLNLLLTLGE